MKAFTYERAATPAEAAASAQRTPGAKFIAGGTNLLDLMKLEIETPVHLIDVNGLALDTIEPTENGGLRIGALVRNTDLAADRCCAATTPCSHARCWPARPGSYATGRRPPGISCSAPAAPISTIPTRRAISVSPVAAAPPCRVTAAS